MAWCLWDMLTHPPYGMGKRLGAADVDKWALYVIGQDFDPSVADGVCGAEPRTSGGVPRFAQRKAGGGTTDGRL
ncbi:phage host specificity protein [Escherichia coli]|nr:phage host specificity protein [Escherichia coli]